MVSDNLFFVIPPHGGAADCQKWQIWCFWNMCYRYTNI